MKNEADVAASRMQQLRRYRPPGLLAQSQTHPIDFWAAINGIINLSQPKNLEFQIRIESNFGFGFCGLRFAPTQGFVSFASAK